MDRIARDVRIALRGFRRTPTFTVTAVLILALGIGMAAAMATVFDAVLLRKLPVREQEGIVVLWPYRDPAQEFGLTRGDLKPLREGSRTTRGIAAFAHWGATAAPLLDGDRVLVLNQVLVTGTFFDVLGARPVLGRFLRPDDELAGATRVMVLSYRVWQQQFGGDPRVIGRQVTAAYSQWRYTIVGVAPAGLDYPTGVGYWTPPWEPGDGLSVIGIARLAPNATPATASAELFAIKNRLSPELRLKGVRTIPFMEAVLGRVQPMLVVLAASVALLLLIACVNVGNLLLLRAASRARELAVRRALGATYGDVLRQLSVESALLGVAGGTLGLLCASGLLRLLLVFAPTQLPRTDVIGLAGAPFGMALGVSMVAVLVFGIVPALAAARGNVSSPLRLDARSGHETRRRRSVRQSLVAAQVALAMVMLAGAGLLARSLARLQHIDLGFSAEHLSILQFTWPARYNTESKIVAFGAEMAPRLRGIPGVTALTPILIPPFVGANVFYARLDPEGQPAADREGNSFVPLEVGGEEYFRTFGIPIVRGRGFLESDREDSPQVAVVSEAVARRVWPNENPIGKRVKYWGPDTLTWRTVVGVAGDIRFRSLREATATVYLPWRQAYWQVEFAVRTQGALAPVLAALRREAHAIDPQLTLWSAHAMDELLGAPLAQPRLSAMLLSGFALVALLLAAIGLYGVMASAVREQTREIGVRMALGATPARVRGDILRRSLGMVGVGAGAGVAGALISSRLYAALLYEVSPTDPTTLAAVGTLLMGVALVAAYLPARRATRIDPAVALRSE
jgi:putative ABC transport system permease protein